MEGRGGLGGFKNLLELPQIKFPPVKKTKVEPRIDYQKSILLTEAQHIQELEDIAAKREIAL